MPEPEVATLKDVTAAPNPADAKPQEPAKPAVESQPAAAPAPVKVQDSEALEVGRLLLESGYTKDQVNEVLAAPQALQSMRYLIRENPVEFVNLLERTDPDAGANFLGKVAQLYVDRYAPKDTPAPGKGGNGTAANPELMQEVTALREEVNKARTEREQERARASTAQVQSRYTARVDDLFAQIPKEAKPTAFEQDLLRAKLDHELATDPNVVQRVSNGNFVDVPRRFQSILDGWAADKKAAAEATKAARDRTAGTAIPEFQSGPVELPKEFTEPGADIWDEAPLVKAFQNAQR